MKTITARTMVELKASVYAAHGWQRKAGESMGQRIKELYDVRLDARRNILTATPKNAQ